MKKFLTGLLAVVALLSFAAPVNALSNTEKAAELREAAKVRAEAQREKQEDKVNGIKQEVEARKLVLKQEKCEAREAKIKALMPKLSKGATSVKGSIDKVYDRVVGFYDSGQLTVSNYEELVNAIELAKADAETSLDTVETYEFELDCTVNGVGGQLDGYRTAVKEAKESLKTYRKSVVALISSMRSANANANSDDTDSEDTDTEDEDTTDTTDQEQETNDEN